MFRVAFANFGSTQKLSQADSNPSFEHEGHTWIENVNEEEGLFMFTIRFILLALNSMWWSALILWQAATNKSMQGKHCADSEQCVSESLFLHI